MNFFGLRDEDVGGIAIKAEQPRFANLFVGLNGDSGSELFTLRDRFTNLDRLLGDGGRLPRTAVHFDGHDNLWLKRAVCRNCQYGLLDANSRGNQLQLQPRLLAGM